MPVRPGGRRGTERKSGERVMYRPCTHEVKGSLILYPAPPSYEEEKDILISFQDSFEK